MFGLLSPRNHVFRDAPSLQITVGVVIAVGLLLRVVTSFQSFWLDEIWSYYLAQDLDACPPTTSRHSRI